MTDITAELLASIDEAEQRTGLPRGLLRSVVQQETGGDSQYIADPAKYHYPLDASGKRTVPRTGKVSTAFGPFGILESTATDPGYGVAPLKDKSLQEQTRFSAEYLAARIKQAGSVKKGLAGYGEGDAYAQQVVGRIGGEGVKAAYDQRIEAAVQASIVREPDKRLFDAGMQLSAFEAQIKQEAQPTGWEMFGGAMAKNTDHRLVDAVKERIWGEEFPAVPGYKSDLKALPITADSDLVEEYANATSPEKAAKLLKAHEEEEFRVQAITSRGTKTALALGLAAEGAAVTNYLMPFAAAKTLARFGMGSMALAQSGNYTKSVATAIGENALSGTVVEAATQGLEGRVSGQDLLVSAVADSMIGLVTGVHGAHALRATEGLVNRAAGSAIEQELRYAQRAEAELGAGASTGDLRQVMDRLYKEDLNATVKSSLSEVAPDRQLVRETEATVRQQDVETPQVSPSDIEMPTPRFATAEQLAQRELDMAPGGKFAAEFAKGTGGKVKTAAEFNQLGAGLHTVSAVPREARVAVETAEKLVKAFLPNHTVTLNFERVLMKDGRFANGEVVQTGRTGAMITIDPTLAPSQIIRSTMHEVGHVVFNSNLSKAKVKDLRGVMNAWREFVAEVHSPGLDGSKARGMRFSLLNVDQMAHKELTVKPAGAYELDFDEFAAEQFVKYMERSLATDNKFGLTQVVVRAVRDAMALVIDLFKKAQRELPPEVDLRFSDFLDNVLKDAQAAAPAAKPSGVSVPARQFAVSAKPADVVDELMTDPDAVRFGLNIVPVSTATERKHAQAMLALHKQAADWEKRNPMDEAWNARVQNLADNNVFNVASTGLLMLKSPSPLVRMIASELLEDASGVAGKRQATAAISKYMTERFMLGNAINDVQGAYQFWKKGKPGGLRDDLVGGNNWAAFNKELAAEIEARRLSKGPVSQDPNIKAAADSLEAAYQRTANAQRQANTLGSEGLPESSVGYMPHRMSPKAVINMTNEQSQILHSALTDQFITIEGWDASFSDRLASSYIKRVRDRASGDYGSNVGGMNPGTASLVEEALRGMDLPEDTIKQHMDKFAKGGANFTKGRIELDLNKVYQTADGEFRLLDIFETNQLELLRSQAGRASGEVALTKWGIRGKPGLKLLRDAMGYGEDGKRAGVKEMESFDQIAAEFMNEPFGTQSGKFMERAMAANTLVRLGGIVFNQIAESLNGIMHVGLARTAASVASIPRLRSEIKALARGEKVDNPFLSSIEHTGGAEFGTDAYKIVMPFDSPDHAYPTYGQDTLTLTDRLLRGGGHLQSKLSGWRMVHSAQQRGMAEQIVHKMAKYLRDGKDDVALQQFGITPEMRAALRSDLPNVATFDGAGNLVRFDVTKITDPGVREQVIQAVWRGTSQIIQGTYIGERGKWAHDGWLKLMTQFRTFSITSMEKQWGRQRNSRGAAAAYGLLIGSMGMAIPVYMARVYANSVGRPDQDAYIEERLEPQALARATLNYVAMAGMAGDLIDLLSSTLPEELGVKPTGGRAGVETDFVGNYVLPASSLVNDIWKYAQSPLELDDAVKVMPMSRLPYLVPLMNGARE